MSAGAFLRLKKLKGAGKIRVAAAHNLRAIAAEIGAASHIDPARCRLNVHLAGPETPQGVSDLADALMHAAGVAKLRKDAVRAIEVLFSLPQGLNGFPYSDYFAACVEWAGAEFGAVLCADVHHDEAAPHVHVLCLPLVDGRLVGSDLVGGPGKLRALQADFHTKVARVFGLKRAGARRQSAVSREQWLRGVLGVLKARCDPVLKSALWPVIRDVLERDPRPFAETLGFEPESEGAGPSRRRSFTAIMIGRGKGARTEQEEQRRSQSGQAL